MLLHGIIAESSNRQAIVEHDCGWTLVLAAAQDNMFVRNTRKYVTLQIEGLEICLPGNTNMLIETLADLPSAPV